MKQMLKHIGLAMIVVSTFVGSGMAAEAVAAGPSAGELLRNAYLSVVDAELARAEQHDAEAVSAYRTALGLYGRLQAEYPGWQAAMVSYRVAECQNALTALEATPAGGPDVKAAVTAANGTNTGMRLQSLLVEIQDATRILATETNALVGADVKAVKKELRQVQDQLAQETKANQSLIRKLSKMEAKLNRAGLAEGTNTQCKAVSAAVKSEARRLIEDKKTDNAITLLREAVDMMPSEHDLLIQLALAHCRIGRFADAIQALQPFDVRHPTNAEAMLCMGAAYMGMGEVGQARVATEKALALKPDSAEANYNMAQILISIVPPDLEAVQQHYRRALELGLAPDAEFENTLRTALVISKVKKRAGQSKSSSFGGSVKKALQIPTP